MEIVRLEIDTYDEYLDYLEFEEAKKKKNLKMDDDQMELYEFIDGVHLMDEYCFELPNVVKREKLTPILEYSLSIQTDMMHN